MGNPCRGALVFLFAGLLAPGAAAAQPAVHVKKAVAATMTPEELADYTARLAATLASRRTVAPLPADTCDESTFETSELPYGPVSDTTAGQTDDYDLPPDTTAPTCTAATECLGAPSGRGNVYTGTGVGPDRAYRIRTDAACDLTITVDPTDSTDLALIVYEGGCSNDLADCACVDDTGVGGAAETVTLSAVANTDYFIVVDGYSVGAAAPGPSGPFTLSITGDGCSLVDPSATTTTTSSTTTTTGGGGASTTTTTTSGPGATTTTTLTLGPSGCTGGVAIEKAHLKITRVGGTPGDEGVQLSGVLQFAADTPASFDPAAQGAQLLLEDLGAGAALFDLSTATHPVPPGVRGTGCASKDGWKGTRYKNVSGAVSPPGCPADSASGLRSLAFSDKRAKGKGLKFVAKAAGTSVPAPVGPVRMTIVTSADPSAAAAGQCGTHTFDAGACTTTKKGFVCK